jgi:mannitol/fructose-specific phosphotransferase system IIA component (Ntr-type)
MVKIQQFLKEQMILLGLTAKDREDAFRLIIQALVESRFLEAGKEYELLDGLSELEKMGSFALGNGVALPHVYSQHFSEPMIVFAKLATPVEFGEHDDQPVDKIFLLVGPKRDETEFVMVIARLSRLLRDREFYTLLEAATSPNEVIVAVKDVEERH